MRKCARFLRRKSVVPGVRTPRMEGDEIIGMTFELNGVIRTFRNDNFCSSLQKLIERFLGLPYRKRHQFDVVNKRTLQQANYDQSLR
jgi:hypothetical protein